MKNISQSHRDFESINIKKYSSRKYEEFYGRTKYFAKISRVQYLMFLIILNNVVKIIPNFK